VTKVNTNTKEIILREKLIEHIKNYGIKQSFIANKTNLNKTLLCRWLKGNYNKPLWQETIDALENYLNEFYSRSERP